LTSFNEKSAHISNINKYAECVTGATGATGYDLCINYRLQVVCNIVLAIWLILNGNEYVAFVFFRFYIFGGKPSFEICHIGFILYQP